jgi:secreted PhoX family phosphatase
MPRPCPKPLLLLPRGFEYGATFEPKNGNWLFVNIQTPGITFAITGPWKQGSL